MARSTEVSSPGSTRPEVDPDGLSFFTAGQSQEASPTVFRLPTGDPLDRVFGDTPLAAGDETGTSDLSATASGEQVMGDISGRLTDKGSTAWRRAFILYGPPMNTDVVAQPRTILNRFRRKVGEAS